MFNSCTEWETVGLKARKGWYACVSVCVCVCVGGGSLMLHHKGTQHCAHFVSSSYATVIDVLAPGAVGFAAHGK